MKMINAIKKVFADERGISAVEYALLLALIGAGIAAAAFALGDQVGTNIDQATDNLQAPAAG